jgi:hypothetical protein
MNQEAWQRIWARWHWLVGLVTLAGLALYLSSSLYRLSTGSYGPTGATSRVDSSATPGMAYNAGLIIYATGLSLLLLVISERLATALAPGGSALQRAHRGERVKRSLARGLEWFGTYSLPMYLLHPLVFEALKTPTLHGVVDRLPLSPLWAGMLLFGVSGLLSWLCRLSGLDVLLFGRRLVPTPVRPRRQERPSVAIPAVPADAVPVADISPDLGAVELPLAPEQATVAAVRTPDDRNSRSAAAPAAPPLLPGKESAESLPIMVRASVPPRPSRRGRRSSSAAAAR